MEKCLWYNIKFKNTSMYIYDNYVKKFKGKD